MGELLDNIISKWKRAGVNRNTGEAEFQLMNTSSAHEFLHLLETWRVPYKAVTGPLYIYISTLEYYYVMRNKDYYSDNGITAEMEAEYYA